MTLAGFLLRMFAEAVLRQTKWQRTGSPGWPAAMMLLRAADELDGPEVARECLHAIGKART